MSASLLDLSDRDELDDLAELVAEVHIASAGVALLLVGATARDLLLYHAHKIPLSRSTFDVDFAVRVSTWGDFALLRETLVSSGRFEQIAQHRLRHPAGRSMDLLPFGTIESPERTITWPIPADQVMNVLGYREACETSVRVLLPNNEAIDVVNLPMLAILKVLAWADRHVLVPRKDAADILLLLRTYLDAGNSDRLYTDAFHVLGIEPFDEEHASA